MAAIDSRHLPPIRSYKLWPSIHDHSFRCHHLLPTNPIFTSPADEQPEEVRHYRYLSAGSLHDNMFNHEDDPNKRDCLWQWELHHVGFMGQH